jgi:hypothetical protein
MVKMLMKKKRTESLMRQQAKAHVTEAGMNSWG